MFMATESCEVLINSQKTAFPDDDQEIEFSAAEAHRENCAKIGKKKK